MTNYERFLRDLVDELYEDAAGREWSWKEFAGHSRLSYSTIFRLGMRITRFPRFDTIFKIATALDRAIEIRKRVKHRLRKAA